MDETRNADGTRPDPNAGFLADVARARANDGSRDGGLERVVRMAQSAAVMHEATSLAQIRPDLADEEPTVDLRVRPIDLVRPSGPVRRLSRLGIVKRRIDLGLDSL